MKTLGNILGAGVALVLTAALGYGGYIAVHRFVVLFMRLNLPTAIVTATAAGVLLLAAVIIAASIRRAGAQHREVHLRAGKAAAYKLFIGFWEGMLRPGQTDESLAQLSQQMQDVNHALLLHGCPAVVKAHAAMQSLNLPEARAQFADSLLAIRKDLGLVSQGLGAKELVQLLLGEPDNTRASYRPEINQNGQPRVSLASNS